VIVAEIEKSAEADLQTNRDDQAITPDLKRQSDNSRNIQQRFNRKLYAALIALPLLIAAAVVIYGSLKSKSGQVAASPRRGLLRLTNNTGSDQLARWSPYWFADSL
jgi:hypothetical protein